VDAIELIGTTMGLGFVAGVRLYATILTLGLAIRFGWFHPGPIAEPLRILAEPPVLIAAGVACAIEFFADKVPWVDSIWDSFHAFIRPIGAVVVSAAVLGSVDPVLRVTLIILCGGVAFTSHSTKAATRLLVNHSPEPFSNIGISLAEDALVPFGVWLSLRHPQIVFGLVLVFLVVFIWVAPKVFRAVRLQFAGLCIWLGVGERTHQNGASVEHQRAEQFDRLPGAWSGRSGVCDKARLPESGVSHQACRCGAGRVAARPADEQAGCAHGERREHILRFQGRGDSTHRTLGKRREGWGAHRTRTVKMPKVNPKFIVEFMRRKCRSFDSAEERFAQDDRLFWGLVFKAFIG